ncbi:Hypothetical predicted protein, partial [Marmota monax]
SHNEELPKREKTVTKTLAEFYSHSSLYKDTKAELEEPSGGLKKRSPAFMETTYVTPSVTNSDGFPGIHSKMCCLITGPLYRG